MKRRGKGKRDVLRISVDCSTHGKRQSCQLLSDSLQQHTHHLSKIFVRSSQRHSSFFALDRNFFVCIFPLPPPPPHRLFLFCHSPANPLDRSRVWAVLASVGQEVQSVFALAYLLAIIIKLPSYPAYSGVSFSVCLLQSASVITTEAYHFEKHFRDRAPSEYLSVCAGKDDPTIVAVLPHQVQVYTLHHSPCPFCALFSVWKALFPSHSVSVCLLSDSTPL